MDAYKMNNLKKLRKERNITQLNLQMQTGIEQSLISKYESGERTPPTETLLVLADFFNTSVDYVLGVTEEKTPYPRIDKNRDK